MTAFPECFSKFERMNASCVLNRRLGIIHVESAMFCGHVDRSRKKRFANS